MSQENVEVVRGAYDAFARRDNAAPFAAYALDIELVIRDVAGQVVTTSLPSRARMKTRTWRAGDRVFLSRTWR